MVFMKCERCGNLITYLYHSGVYPQCCGEPMKMLVPGISDGKAEAHVPVLRLVTGTCKGKSVSRVIVDVGDIAHPMSENHFIQWILLETDQGFKIHNLTPYDEPKAVFELDEETPIAAYAYCNIHGLWRAEI